MSMEIDSLEIAIQAQANDAAKEIDALNSKLSQLSKNLNSATGGYRKTATEIGRIAAAVRSVAAVRPANLSGMIQQLETLSKLDFKGITGKKFTVDIDVNAPKSVSQVKWAVEKAFESAKVDASKISESLIKEFSLKGKAKTEVERLVNELTETFAKGFDGNGISDSVVDAMAQTFEKVSDIIRENGKILSESIEDYERLASTSGKAIFYRGFEALDTRKSIISEISDPAVMKNAEEAIAESVHNAVYFSLPDSFKGAFDEAVKAASSQLSIDIDVNQDKIVSDIKNAINTASKVTYEPVKVTLDVGKETIKNKVAQELKSIQVGNLNDVADAYKKLVDQFGTLNAFSNNKGINTMINTIRKLAQTDMSGFDVEKFTQVTSAIASLASLDGATKVVGNLVNSLIRLAKVSADMEATTKALPTFADAVKSAFDTIGQANVSDTSNTLITAISRLAGQGGNMGTAAQNLPALTESVQGFFAAMSQAPEVSDTTLRMTEALARTAQRGSKLDSTASKLSGSMTKLANTGNQAHTSLAKLPNIGNTVKNAFSGLLDIVKRVASAIGKGATTIAKGFLHIGNSSKHVNKATLSLKNLLQVALGFYGIRSLFNWGKEAVTLASDLTEVQNVVENAFGEEGTKLVENFTKTSIQDLGMSELTAKSMASRFQAMGQSMGITADMVGDANKRIGKYMDDAYKNVSDDTAGMSINLTRLAADMASFYNKDQDAVAQSLTAIYTGQTRPLRQYGIDLTQATLQEWANKQGIDAKVSSMTQAEKTMLRYQFVMAHTATVQGDFARTSMTWANQIRILKQNFEVLGKTIGNVIINVFRPLVIWLNNAMSKVIAFAETIGNALGKIFGWQIMHTPAGTTMDDLADGFEDIGDAGDDAADGTDKANKALKEYQNTVMGFDQLNKLNSVPDTSSGSGSGSGSGAGSAGGSGDASGADFQIVKKDNWFEDYKSSIDSLEELGSYISQKLTDAMGRIEWDKIYEEARSFGTGLAKFLNSLITPELFGATGGFISSAINTVLNAEDAFLDKFDFKNLGKSIGTGINKFFETFDFDLKAKTFYGCVNGIADAIKSAADEITWNSIGTKISNCVKNALGGIQWEQKVYPVAKSFASGLAKFLNGLFDEKTFSTLGTTVGKTLNTALQFLNTWGTEFKWDKFGISIAAGIKSFFNTFDWKLAATNFGNLATGILTSIREAIGNVNWSLVGYKIRTFLLNIPWANLIQSVGDTIMAAISGALDAAKSLLVAPDDLGSPLAKAFDRIKKAVTDFKDAVDWEKLARSVGNLVKALEPAVKGFADGLADVFERIGKLGSSTLNAIADMFQGIADALNSLPEGVTEQLGKDLSTIATALAAIAGVKTVSGILKGVIGNLLGLGSAGASAAAGASGAAEAVTSGAAAAGATKLTWSAIAGKLGELASGFKANLGVSAAFTESVKHTMSVSDENAYLGLTNSLSLLRDKGVLTTDQFNELEAAMTKTHAQGGKLPDVLETATTKLGEMGVKTGALNTYQDDLIKILGTFGVKAKDQITILDGLGVSSEKVREKTTGLSAGFTGAGHSFDIVGTKASTSKERLAQVQDAIEKLKNKGIDLHSTGVGGLLSSLGDIATKSGDADSKSSEFKSNLWKFAGGIAAQSVLMLVMGTAFKGVGDKATDAQDPVTNLKGKIKDFADSIGGYKKTVETNSDAVGDAVPTHISSSMDAKSNLPADSFDDMLNEMMAAQGQVFGPEYSNIDAIGTNVDDTLATSVTNGKDKVVGAMAAVGEGMRNAIEGTGRGGWNMGSPSKVADDDGRNIMQGLYNGLNAISSQVVSKMQTVVSDMHKAITDEYDDFKTAGKNLADNFKNGLKGVSFSDVGTAWKKALDMSGLQQDMYSAGQKIAGKVSSGMKSISLPRLRYYISSWESHDLGGGKTSQTPVYSPNWYARGGFPNLGELFIANENGIEMMGRMGNRNVVANNEQITEGIKAAVVDGFMEAFMATNSGGNDELPYQLNIQMVTPDGEVLARQVERGQARRSARFNTVGYSY